MKSQCLQTDPEKNYVVFMLFALVLLLLPITASGASFDCKKSHTFIERAICSNKHLSKMDDRLDEAYKKALEIALAPDELKEEQRKWLTTERDVCQDEACLERVYEERLASLATYDERQRTSHGKEICGFPDLKLPKEYAVFAAGGNSSRRKLGFQIDQTGLQATQIDVAVNFSSKPVMLILGVYAPTIWNISWTPGTRIAAVLLSGYHRQVVAGLDTTVPMQNISLDENKGPCRDYVVNPDDLSRLNPTSRRFFGRPVDLFYRLKDDKVVIGDAVPAGLKLITSASITPESFYDKTAPLAGLPGIEDAVRKGLLRKATDADADAWIRAVVANRPHGDAPSIAKESQPKPLRPSIHNAYVVLKPFTYPAGLYGDNTVKFFIPKGVPHPQGNLAHSCVFDFNTLKREGITCNQ